MAVSSSRKKANSTPKVLGYRPFPSWKYDVARVMRGQYAAGQLVFVDDMATPKVAACYPADAPPLFGGYMMIPYRFLREATAAEKAEYERTSQNELAVKRGLKRLDQM